MSAPNYGRERLEFCTNSGDQTISLALSGTYLVQYRRDQTDKSDAMQSCRKSTLDDAAASVLDKLRRLQWPGYVDRIDDEMHGERWS